MTYAFAVALRGYDREQVDALLAAADDALATDAADARAAARAALANPDLTIVLRGYFPAEVEEAIQERLRLLDGGAVSAAPARPRGKAEFTVVLRGYERSEVDQLLARADEAEASDSAILRASVRDALATAAFPKVWRGYDTGQVNREIQNRLTRLT